MAPGDSLDTSWISVVKGLNIMQMNDQEMRRAVQAGIDDAVSNACKGIFIGVGFFAAAMHPVYALAIAAVVAGGWLACKAIGKGVGAVYRFYNPLRGFARVAVGMTITLAIVFPCFWLAVFLFG
jgi:hypothetical protein